MSKRKNGLQKSIASVFKDAELPSEVQGVASEDGTVGPAECPTPDPSRTTTPSNKPPTPKGPIPVYIPEPPRKQSIWSVLWHGRSPQ